MTPDNIMNTPVDICLDGIKAAGLDRKGGLYVSGDPDRLRDAVIGAERLAYLMKQVEGVLREI